jgi:Ca-activated chloride channel family protein
MHRLRVAIGSLILVGLQLLFPIPAYADGIIIPEPPICDPIPCPPVPKPMAQLAIEYHHVQVDIDQQVATTHVDQVFRNDNPWTVEGTYIFPLPTGAMVTEFVLWVDGEPVEAKILERDEARQVYEQIVREIRDPALLEYADRGAVQASIFPIPAGGTRRIELEYTQVLPAEGGLIRYTYPLNTEKFSAQPLEEVSVSVSVDSADPVRAVYSPTHDVGILREGDHRFQVGYEAADITPDRDFELYYSVSEQEIGLNLLTYRDPEGDDPDGFFLLLAAPKVQVDTDRVAPRDLFFVLDQSGSMEGEKFRQAQRALQYVLDNLNAEDRFNIIAFSTGTRSYAEELRGVEDVPEAKRWVESLSAKGSTDINRALLEALAQAREERTTVVIFLTDGLPTEGETDTPAILDNVRDAAPGRVRLFAFGVGYDVDTFLLDSLAKQNGGSTTYVKPDQALDEIVSGFYAQISKPVLTNLYLDFGDVIPFDQYPSELPDLFAGNQLVLVGRYREPGVTAIRLSGEVEGAPQVFTYAGQRFRSSGGAEFLPRLWATRKIGALLQQIRLRGPDEETVDQIVRLSIRYGIVTPYTSYLVTDSEVLGETAQQDIAQEAFKQYSNAPGMVTGQAAVERAAAESEIESAQAPVSPGGDAADLVKIAGSRTFRLVDGVWTDTAFDPGSMSPMKVPFLSEDYFALAQADAHLAAAFSLGERVIAISGGEAYEVIPSDQPGDEISLPAGESPAGAAEDAGPVEVIPDDPARASGDSPSGLIPCPGAFLSIALISLPLMRRRRTGAGER